MATAIRREVRLSNMLSAFIVAGGPRCLFGKPSPADTANLLQETLEMERSRFMNRWGVDPHSEDKENVQNDKCERSEAKSPRKTRSSPYSKQPRIHGENIFIINLNI